MFGEHIFPSFMSANVWRLDFFSFVSIGAADPQKYFLQIRIQNFILLRSRIPNPESDFVFQEKFTKIFWKICLFFFLAVKLVPLPGI